MMALMAAATRTAADTPLRLPGDAPAPPSAAPSEGGSHHGGAGARRRLGLAHSSTPTMADLRDAVEAAAAAAGASGASAAARDVPGGGGRDQQRGGPSGRSTAASSGKPGPDKASGGGGGRLAVQRSGGSDPSLPCGEPAAVAAAAPKPAASPFSAPAAAGPEPSGGSKVASIVTALEPMPHDLEMPDAGPHHVRGRAPPLERIVSGKESSILPLPRRGGSGGSGGSGGAGGSGGLHVPREDAAVAVGPVFEGAWGIHDARPAGGGLLWRLPLDAVSAPDEAFKVPLAELQVAAGALIKTLQQGGRAKASASFKRLSAPMAGWARGGAAGEGAAICAAPLAGM
jgi:hypothetical protein